MISGGAIQPFMYGAMFAGALMAVAPVAGFIRKAISPKKPTILITTSIGFDGLNLEKT